MGYGLGVELTQRAEPLLCGLEVRSLGVGMLAVDPVVDGQPRAAV